VNKKSTDLDVGRDMGEPADLLVAEIVDAGLLSEGVLASFDHACNNLLKPRAATIPAGATIYAMPIESREIDGERRVGKSGGFDIGPLNELAPRLYLQTDLRRYEWRGLSRATRVFDFDFAGGRMPESERHIALRVSQSGVCHAIAVWFRLRLDDDIAIATGPNDANTHWKQAVYAMSPPLRLTAGKAMTLRARHNRNTLFLDLIR
jgi:type II protein arginine methyltransferase